MLALLDEKLNFVENEKTDLKNKLEQSKTQSILDNQTIKKLEHNLTQVNNELQKSKDIQLSINDDLNSMAKQCVSFAREIGTLKITLFEKDNQLIQCKNEKQELNTKISTLEKQFQIEKQKFDEEK